jgi:polyisoprenoid-binding protein YceI
MMRFALITGTLALAAPLALAQTSTWTSDPAHSQVEFSISHLTVATVHGHFGKITATVQFNEGDITQSSVKATIDVNGVDTGESPRDSVLKSSDFFNVDNFPTAFFTSTRVVRNGNKLTITGNLTLRGVTKPVVLDAEGPTGPVAGMDHKPHSSFSATTSISRTAFGIASMFPAATISDDAKLTIELEIIKQ